VIREQGKLAPNVVSPGPLGNQSRARLRSYRTFSFAPERQPRGILRTDRQRILRYPNNSFRCIVASYQAADQGLLFPKP
jgi:hypothetical protein